MPSKHILKTYAKNCYYHIFNRGVEKRDIFLDLSDYSMFIYNIRRYLEPGFKAVKYHPITNEKMYIEPKQVIGKMNLLSFCLMPNHFHFLVKLLDKDGVTDFMRKICANYVMYFNDKYERVGTLFQGRFKAVRITSEEQYIHLSRYIHSNPMGILKGMDLCSYKYSSFYYICKNRKPSWLDLDLLLGNRKWPEYVGFVKCVFDKGLRGDEKRIIDKVLLE